MSELEAITTMTAQIAEWEKAKDAAQLLDCAIVQGGVLERAACDSLEKLGKAALAACRTTLADDSVQPFHRFSAARIFGVIAGKSDTAELLGMLDHEELAVQRGAAEGLGYHVNGAKAVAKLTEALESPDPPLRRAAVQALQALGSKKSVGAMVHLLADRAPSVRRAAALAVGALGGAERATDLAGRIHDRDRSVRRALAQSLALVGSPETAAPLMKLSLDEAVDIRHEAVKALGKLLTTAPEVEDRLIDALEDRARQVRRAAAQILGEHKVERAVQGLCDLLRDGPDRLSQITAAWGLGEIGAEAAVERLAYSLLVEDFNLQDAAQKALFKILGKVDIDVYRARATVALERWERVVQFGRSATEPLVRVARNRERTVQSVRIRCAAARALGILGRMGDERAIPPLLEMLDDTLPAPRRAAAAALAGLGDAAVAAKLVALLDSHDPTLRAAGLRALGTLGNPDSVQRVHTIGQGDEGPEIRLAAVEALAGFGAPALAALSDFLSGDNEIDLRLAAVDSLAALGTPLAIDPLLVALGDAVSAVRFAAGRALGAYGWRPIGLRRQRTDRGYSRWTARAEWTSSPEPIEQVDLLVAGLGHEDPALRRAAAEGLADLRASTAAPALTAALGDADVDVAAVVGGALVALGTPPGDGPQWIPYHAARLDEARVLAAGAKAVPTLASQIRSLDPEQRIQTAALLGALAHPDCVPVLMAALPDLEEEVIDAVLAALARTGLEVFDGFYGKRRKKAEQQELVEELSPVAAHPRPDVRLWAVRAIAAVAHDDAVPVLVSALADTDVPVVCVAVRSLGLRKATEHLELLLSLLRSTGSDDLRRALLEALGAAGDPAATEAMARFLRYPNPDLQQAAQAALRTLLGKRYDQVGLEALADLVAEKWDSLVAIGGPALDHLVATLTDRDPTPLQNARRYHAAVVMGRIGGARVPDLLVAELNDPSAQVRQGALEGLAAAGEPKTVEAIRLCLTDSQPVVREAAVRALGALHATETSEEVGRLYQDDSAAVQAAAVEVLSSFDTPAILPVVEILEGGDVAAKCAAADALATIGDPAAIRYLEFALGDSEYAVRRAAQNAMIALGWTPVGVRTSVVSDKPARWTKREEWVEQDAKTSQPDVLLAALEADSPLRRRVAAETLGDLRHEPAAAALRTVATSDPDVETRMVACKALVDLGAEPTTADAFWAPYYALVQDWRACRELGAAAVQPLLRMMRSTRASVRREVAELLGEAGAEVALPVIGDLLYDPSPLLRAAGAEAMARVGGPAASEALLQAFGAEEDPAQRLNLVRAALMLGDKLAIRLVQAAERDPAPMVRTVAEEYQATRALFGATD